MVGNHAVVAIGIGLECLEGLDAGAVGFDVIPKVPQCDLNHLDDGLFIIHDQDHFAFPARKGRCGCSALTLFDIGGADRRPRA